MTFRNSSKDTDLAWEQWGSRDPYFAVLTDPKYRLANLDPQAFEQFFLTGALHVKYVLDTIRQHLSASYRPQRVLEFGCGVGRLLIPFSEFSDEVIGLDVSPSMLAEAKRNCDARNVCNVSLLLADDSLSNLSGEYDLIHSCLVFQHIPPERGRRILKQLLCSLSQKGVVALHFLYSKSAYEAFFGAIPASPPVRRPSLRRRKVPAEPEMRMDPYVLNEVFFLLQAAGVATIYADFTDHEGELGIFIYGKRPGA